MAKTHLDVIELLVRDNFIKEKFVLCAIKDGNGGVREFVVWNEFDNAYNHGHYFSNTLEGLKVAIKDLESR